MNKHDRAARRTRILSLGIVVVVALLSGSVQAQHSGVSIKRPFHGQRASEINIHAGLSNNWGPAFGGRLAIPLVDNGFVSKINNAIYLTLGADILFERCPGCGKNDDNGLALAIPITGRWQFNFTPMWSAYGEVGPNIYLHSRWFDKDIDFKPGKNIGRHWVAGAIGGKLHFARDMSFTMALGFPYSHVGLDFPL